MMKRILIVFFIVFCCTGLTFSLHAKTLLLEDFNSGTAAGGLNKFSGINNTWAPQPPDPNATAEVNNYNDSSVIFGGKGCSAMLYFNVNTPDSYAGYTLGLNGQSLKGYHYLSFRVKGDGGGEFFKVELKCRNPNSLANTKAQSNHAAGKFYITDYLDGGVIPSWKKVVVPLDNFSSIDQWTNMYELTFAFENSASDKNDSPKSGTIYLDDIVFGTWEMGCVRIDHYGDLLSTAGMGGNMGSGGSGGLWQGGTTAGSCTNSFNAAEFHDSKHSFQIDYNVTSGYCFSYSFFGGGITSNAGWIPVQADFSKYDNLTFWAKCTNASIFNQYSFPYRGLKIEMDIDDDSAMNYFQYLNSDLTQTWKKFSFTLSDFQFWTTGNFIDKTKIAKLTWVFDGGNIEPNNTIGRVYIDDVQFETAGYSKDIAAPQTPSLFKCGGITITNGFAFKLTNILSVVAQNGSFDPSLEGIFFEYSPDSGTTWYLMGTDYDTTNTEYSIQWNTTGLANNANVRVRAYAVDAAGNSSGFIGYDGKVITSALSGELKKISQKILTPNNDGFNDTLPFEGLSDGFTISIYTLKGVFVRKIVDDHFWDAKDKNGKLVEGGIYIYQVKSGGKQIEGTVVIRK